MVLTGGDFAAIGIGTDPDLPFDPWVWSGLSEDEAVRIGATPRARGVLGWVASRGELLRVPRLQDHPASRGVPAGHPPMDAFLGTPILRDGRSIGNLYLAKKPGGAPFTAEDESLVALLAGHAAIALGNARLYDERQAAVRVREEVLAVVSHDLRGPLNAIGLRAQLLTDSQEDPFVRANARGVNRSVAMMDRMISALVDGSSLAAGGLRLAVAAHDFRALVDEAVDALSPIAKTRDVHIDVQIPALPLEHFDRDRMMQTVWNLASNAVKFSPPGGRVIIAAEPREHELEVSVSDSGAGITPEALPRVFDRYFTTGTGHGGTGLGLHIAKGVVAAHGGRIWVDSTLGVGSTFHFTLPGSRSATHRVVAAV